MKNQLFPTRIETDRLVFEKLCHETVDPFEFYAFVSSDNWQGEATDPMPWFRFQTIDGVAEFINHTEKMWEERECARYLLRLKETTEDKNQDDGTGEPKGELVGTTALLPDWDKRYAGSDIVLSREYWGRGYGPERGHVFIELTFEQYDLDAYCTSCATNNDPSRRMIEKLIDRYGGQYEGLLRQFGSPRPTGEVTDQHRYSITRDEYREATTESNSQIVDIDW